MSTRAIRSGNRVIGLERVLTRLNKTIPVGQTRNLTQGLVALGLKIQRDSQKMAPVDTGNMKASAFTVWTRGRVPQVGAMQGKTAGKTKQETEQAIARVKGKADSRPPMKPEVAVAYGAAYAIYVHENEMATHLTAKKRKGQAVEKRRGRKLLKAVVAGDIAAGDVRQNGEAKFLEKALRNNVPLAKTIVKRGGWRT